MKRRPLTMAFIVFMVLVVFLTFLRRSSPRKNWGMEATPNRSSEEFGAALERAGIHTQAEPSRPHP